MAPSRSSFRGSLRDRNPVQDSPELALVMAHVVEKKSCRPIRIQGARHRVIQHRLPGSGGPGRLEAGAEIPGHGGPSGFQLREGKGRVGVHPSRGHADPEAQPEDEVHDDAAQAVPNGPGTRAGWAGTLAGQPRQEEGFHQVQVLEHLGGGPATTGSPSLLPHPFGPGAYLVQQAGPQVIQFVKRSHPAPPHPERDDGFGPPPGERGSGTDGEPSGFLRQPARGARVSDPR